MESKEGGGETEMGKDMKGRMKNEINYTETRKEREIIQRKKQSEINLRKKAR
jgi:hypothetical protein